VYTHYSINVIISQVIFAYVIKNHLLHKEKEVKPVKREVEEVAQPNFTELENLYRSIR